jgi:tetratricopeptide (TPR) repeat protein
LGQLSAIKTGVKYFLPHEIGNLPAGVTQSGMIKMNDTIDKIEKKSSGLKHFMLFGCLMPFLILALIVGGLIFWHSGEKSQQQPPKYITVAEKKVVKRQKSVQLRQKKLLKSSNPRIGYDPDQTVMALFSIEQALKNAKTFKELTSLILQKDSELIAPEVAELKYRFFDIYKDLLRAEDDLSEQQSLYNITSGALLDMFSAVKLDLSIAPSIDHDQARAIWTERLRQAELRDAMSERLRKSQDRLLKFYFDYMKISNKYLKDWNELCAYRDRAYIAIFEGDIEAAIKNAGTAIKLAPHEKEAHLLLARCLLQRNAETDRGSAKIMIDEFLKKHQGQEAPAYLLRGVLKMQNKKYDEAIIDLDQAAIYYPKQQERLLDRLNLYKKRHFLNKSKEGRMIINMYRGIMTGSGFFSPDFQLAKIAQLRGDKTVAREKIFDHFFRRRLQGQWNRVLTDFRFCNKNLETDPFKIEGNNISLEISPAFFFNSVIAKIHNGSDRDIHNVTLLLCVRFTDMFKGDYISFPVGATQAKLPAGQSITVGRRDISDVTIEKLGTKKQFKDIIDYAAVLISDEIITWVEPRPAIIKKSSGKQNKMEIATEIAQAVIDMASTDDKKVANEQNKALAAKLIREVTKMVSANSSKDEPKKNNSNEHKQLINEIIDSAINYIPPKQTITKDGKTINETAAAVKYLKLLKNIVSLTIKEEPKK